MAASAHRVSAGTSWRTLSIVVSPKKGADPIAKKIHSLISEKIGQRRFDGELAFGIERSANRITVQQNCDLDLVAKDVFSYLCTSIGEAPTPYDYSRLQAIFTDIPGL